MMNAKMAEAFSSNSRSGALEICPTSSCAPRRSPSASPAARAPTRKPASASPKKWRSFISRRVAAANRRIGDRYLFGGYKTQKPPVDPEGQLSGRRRPDDGRDRQGRFPFDERSGHRSIQHQPRSVGRRSRNGRPMARQGPDSAARGEPARTSASRARRSNADRRRKRKRF